MEFDDDRVDVSGVKDLRGSGRGGGLGRGATIGGGGGIVGLIVVALFVLLGGGLPEGGIDVGQMTSGALGDGSRGESASDLQSRCAQEGAVDTYLDCRMVKVYNVVNTTWDAEFARRGQDYQSPGLAFFSGGVRTGCGTASSQVGPFYCPPDQTMYFDLDFLQQLQRQYGAPGQFAQAYILAHEAGHHLQTLLGIEAQVRQEQQRRPDQVNELSVSLELQADCFAGVWAIQADQLPGEGIVLTPADIDQAMTAAAAVGDDRIQEAAGQRVNPERWTHGSSSQRRDWFDRGYESGDLNACDPFNN